MKKIVAILLCMICLSAYAQRKDNRLTIGTADTIYSKILNEKRAVWIHVTDDTARRYPVLYMMDGEDHFYSAAAIIKQMAGVIPDMIVVGITNTDRERD